MTCAEIIAGLKKAKMWMSLYGPDRAAIDAAIQALTVDEAKVAEIRARNSYRQGLTFDSTLADEAIEDCAALLAMVRK